MKLSGGLFTLLRPEAAILLFFLLFAAGALTAASQPPIVTSAAADSPEQRGAEIFQRERCFFCHSVRDYPMALPRVSFSLGYLDRITGQWTRNGPDLSVISGRRTDDWLLAHLIDPSASVAGCPMPSYANLPDTDLHALVAFINRPGAAIPVPSPSSIARPAVPATRATYLSGRTLYQTYCTGCHGRDGNGSGTVATLLAPEPRDLTNAAWMSKRDNDSLYRVIADGKANTAMPGYAQTLRANEMALVLYYVRFFSNPSARQAMEEGFGGLP